MSTIEFRQVCKRFAPGLPLTINDANLTIEAGEFCVFVGPSGCGKSTLLRLVAGLETVSSGDLLIGGRRVNDVPPAERGVAMVFQSYALYPHMTVAENMAFGLEVAGVSKADIAGKVQQAAQSLQLTGLLDRKPKQLSGGQRQRVAIGRAIVKQPQVFLFDEPLSNLDAALRVQTRLEIARLHREIGGASMIYVTHDQVEAMTLADRIVLLRAGDDVQTAGSVAQHGTPMDLYHRPANLFVAQFIGSPRMNVLAGTLLQAEPAHAVVRVQGVDLRVAVDARRAKAGDAVSLGIRPEHLRVLSASDATDDTLPARVGDVERLGDASMLYLQTVADTPQMAARIEGYAPQAHGQPVRLALPAEHGHLFDAAGQAFARSVATPA